MPPRRHVGIVDAVSLLNCLSILETINLRTVVYSFYDTNVMR